MSTRIDPKLIEILREAGQGLEKAAEDRRRAEALRRLRRAQVALLEEHLNEISKLGSLVVTRKRAVDERKSDTSL